MFVSPFPVKNVAPPLCVLRGTNISYTQEGEGKHLSHSGGHIYIEGRESLYVGIRGGDDHDGGDEEVVRIFRGPEILVYIFKSALLVCQ